MDVSSIFPGYESVDDYCKVVLHAALSCCKASTDMDEEVVELGSTYRGFKEAMAKQRDELLSLIQQLIPGQKLQEHFDSVDEEQQIEVLKDINSSIFEIVSCLLEESDGEKKPEIELVVTTKKNIPINTSWNKKTHLFRKKNSSTLSLLSAKNIARPQFAFKDKIDNTNAIFVPNIKEKPNAIRPLSIILEKDEDGNEQFSHPYECELEKFEPQPDLLEPCEPIIPKPTEEVPFTYVDTLGSLQALCKELKSEKEVAVDLEHHSYRSFQGFTCLLQISTRKKDFIVDCISLRSELWILNEVFTDPKIVKVFHGADMDVIWLQRDFGVYVVNMFDTGQAARVLNFAHLSLSYLMKHYCNVEPNKQFQLADWRMRPLPDELLKYAREDTHYLLYIYDCMRNELLKKGNNMKNLLVSVYQRSKEICLKRYKKVTFSEDKYLELYRKSRKNFNPRQLFCLKELYAWRDRVARVEDESYSFILPNHMLLQISEVLPREHQGILACCNPTPPYIQHNLNELYSIVSKANNYSLAQLQEPQNAIQPSQIRHNVDLSNVLDCPHDIHSYDDTRMHCKDVSETTNSMAHDSRQILVPLKNSPSVSFSASSVQDTGSISRQTRDAVLDKMSRLNKSFFKRLSLTEQYRASLAPDEDEQEKEKHSKSYINVQHSTLDTPSSSRTSQNNTSGTSQRNTSSSSQHSTSSTSQHNATLGTSVQTDEGSDVEIVPHQTSHKVKEEVVCVPKKKKGKKRKENKDRDMEENSGNSEECSNPRKKSKTPNSSFEVSHELFQPFDYSKVGSAKDNKNPDKKNRAPFKPAEDLKYTRFREGRRHHRHRGRGKQASFSSSKTNSSSKHWPKK